MQLMNLIKQLLRSINIVINEVINKNFNKNLIMSGKEEHLFQQSNSSWIC